MESLAQVNLVAEQEGEGVFHRACRGGALEEVGMSEETLSYFTPTTQRIELSLFVLFRHNFDTSKSVNPND